jgi:HK97 family phage portal protein
MGLFDRFLGRQKSFNLQALSKIISGGAWSNSALMQQYEKSLYVFAAINKIAQKVSATDLKLFEIINSKGEVKEHSSHEILDLLYRVNPFQTRSEFWKITTINKHLAGEAIWLKVRDTRGKVVELWNLRPDLVTIVTDESNLIKLYEFDKLDGSPKSVFLPQDIIHFKNPNPLNTWRGLSPLKPAQSRIMTEDYATSYQRDFFANNARPDFYFTSEDDLTPEQKSEILAAWDKRHKGKGKNSRPGILAGGLALQQVSLSQKEMDYIESLKFTRDDILIAFGVPKSVITTDDVNLANANSGLRTFLSETIKPEIAALVEVINEMLVIPDFGERFYVDFQDPTPEDRDMKLKEYQAGYDKWLTPNEIREALNLEPIEGGDTLTRPLGVQVINAPTMQREEEPEKIFRGREKLRQKFLMIEGMADDVLKSIKRKKKAKQSLLKDKDIRASYETFVNKKIDKRADKFKKEVETEAHRQMKRVLNSLEKSFGEKGISDIITFDKKKENKIFSELALPFMVDAATDSGQDALDLIGIGEQFEYTEALEKKLKERAKFFAKSVNDTTLEKLSRTLAEGIEAGEGISELSARVQEVYEEFPTYRSDMIARTESTAVNNEGFQEAYRQSSVVNSQEWVATKDERTRDEHRAMDGEIVAVGKNFSNGLPYPQEPNCRCVLAPVI